MSNRTSVLLAGLVALVLPAIGSDALNFNNNWFVTGDYVVAGVGLRGTGVNGYATGAINIAAGTLPAGAEPIAAFLYWSTVEFTTAPSASDGWFDGHKIRGAVVGNPQNPACWSSGGTTGASSSGATGRSYRADVLRYLSVDPNNIRQVTGSHTVTLPDAGGSGNGYVVYTNGASLVVIYRVVTPGSSSVKPLRAVVSYNGAYTMDKGSTMTQTVAGFYQASSSANAKVTFIVANGQSDFSSPLSVNGTSVSSNAFTGAQGGRWDNPTFPLNLPANASSFDAIVTAGTNQTCETFVAAFASMNVPDTDGDGLLDIWETNGLYRNTQVSPAVFGGCADSADPHCVNLPAMGASVGPKDIFVQLDWLNDSVGLGGNPVHNHKPKPEALAKVCASFANQGIALHFDVGNNYQGQSCIVPYTDKLGKVLARGSEIPESTLACVSTPTHACTYTTPYPVLSFEFGFASVRDGNSKANIPAHFQQARKDTHHYALFAHALAGPFNSSGQPVDPYTGKQVTLPAVPRSYSGIAQRPGGGFMVTLGLWRSDDPKNDQVGSANVQAGTLMHELGHNLGLGHMGTLTKPNCAPNYQSVMNYAYQTRLLTGADGSSNVDYSSGLVSDLTETNLGPLINLNYRVRYFGPLGTATPSSAAAKVHCDGTPINDGALAVRLEGTAVGTPDWGNGTGITSFDVNFDGLTGQTFSDQKDWSNLNLQQIGTGSNFGGLSVGAWATDGGAYATDGGAFATDAGALATDGGVFATDGGAFATDGGAFATDGGVFATDGGAFATDGGAFATDAGDEDYDTHNASGPDAPTTLTATNELNDILLAWNPPASGTVANYDIYRCAGTRCVPTLYKPGYVPTSKSAPTLTDTVNDLSDSGVSCPSSSTCYNTIYTYQVLANVATSGTVTASPLSNSASSKVTHLFVIADAQTAVYGSAPITPPTFKVYGDLSGSLDQTKVSCAYESAAKYIVGPTYKITCSGPGSDTGILSATQGITYNAGYTDGATLQSPGSLTISKLAITVTAVSTPKTYDGNTTSAGVPAIYPSLIPSDVAAFTQTYDDHNAGVGKTLTPSGSVNDGNGGNNYSVKFVSITTGEIDQAPLTITAKDQTKPYGATFTFAGTEFTTGMLYNGDAVNSVTLASAGAAATAAVSSYDIVPSAATGTGLTNYRITYMNGKLTVSPAALTITANNQSKNYGATFTFAGTEFTTGTLYNGDKVSSVTLTSAGAAAAATVGSYDIIPSAATGTGLTNYTITYGNGKLTVNPATLNITANNQSKAYGSTLTFKGTEFTTSTLYNGDKVSSVTLTSAGAAASASVGSYDIVPTAAVGTGLGNYTVIYGNGNLTVNKANTTTQITSVSPEPSIVGGPVTVSVTVAPASGPTVTVAESGASPASCTVTLVNGSGSCTLTPTVVGSKTLTASYAGDSNTYASSGTAKHQVNYTVSISPLKTPAKLGSAVPVNFQVTNFQGVVNTDLSIVSLIQSVFTGAPVGGICGTSSSGVRQTLYGLPNGSTGKSSLRAILSPPSDQFNWDTTTATTTGTGCYTVVITLSDGVPRLTTPVLLQ